ncbi:hypothetical protein CR513_20361, partial [Mucuna pruriens]
MEKENMQPSMKKSEASDEQGHVSRSSRSHTSHRRGNNEKLERHRRHRRERDEPRRDDLERENKPKAYLDWEMKIEKIFACHNIHENLKVIFVTLEFSAYALVWWYQILYDLRERFVPTHYARDLYVKLKRLYQGSKGVEEYFKEMEICMVKAQIKVS